MNHRVFSDWSWRVPKCCGEKKKPTAQKCLEQNLSSESLLYHMEQTLVLRLNAKHSSPTQTSRTSSKEALVTQCPRRIHQQCENPGKALPRLGEPEGTSTSVRHTVVEHPSGKGILQASDTLCQQFKSSGIHC